MERSKNSFEKEKLAAREFSAMLKKHVHKNKGVSNNYLHELASIISPKNCRGVFAVDQAPEDITPPSSIILNLSNSSVPNGHFVAVVVSPNHVFYADPFGMPPPPRAINPDLHKFFERLQKPKEEKQVGGGGEGKKKRGCKTQMDREKKNTCVVKRRRPKKIFFSEKRVQALQSKFCGLYSLLFCAACEKQCSIQPKYFKNLPLTTQHCKENDQKCVKKLCQIVGDL